MKKIKVFECPTCKANLKYRRVVNDGYDLYRINKNGKTKYLGSKSNGYSEVYCSKDQDHLIPNDLRNAAFYIFNF